MIIDTGSLTDLRQIDRLFNAIVDNEDGFGFDIESGYDGPPKEKYSLHPETAVVAGVSVAGHSSWGRYIPLRARGFAVSDSYEREFALLLAQLLGKGRGIAHNLKFELRHLARFCRERMSTAELIEAGLEEDGYFPFLSDAMIETYILGIFRSHGLKYLSGEVFNHDQAELLSLFPPMTKKMERCLRFTDLELSPQVISYACEDSSLCLALSHKHRPMVKERLLYRTEMALVPILGRMEDCGVAFDWESMARVKAEAEHFMVLMEQDIMQELSRLLDTPVSINLGSSMQVADVLYTQLGFKTTKLTGTGNPSTDEDALTGLAKKHDVVARILRWRHMKKLITSYLEKYPRDFNYAPDGRTHSNIQQTAVVSGRFAVSEPGYQQLPKQYHFELDSGDVFDLNFRDFVVSKLDHYLIGFDYSQIELRVMAGYSKEPAMIQAFNDDLDIHAMTASLMFNVPLDEVTKDQRGRGKTQNFAIGYGQGVKGVADRMGISVEEARKFWDLYFKTFSSLKAWISKQTKEGVDAGFTTSKFGRIHPIWQLEDSKPAVRATGERLCVNAPIQGSAADLMKIAMVRSDRALREAGLSDLVHLIMNIHDALVWEVHRSVNPQTIIDIVHPQVCLEIPGWPKIRADWELGTRWGSMTALELDKDLRIVIPQRERELAKVG